MRSCVHRPEITGARDKHFYSGSFLSRCHPSPPTPVPLSNCSWLGTLLPSPRRRWHFSKGLLRAGPCSAGSVSGARSRCAGRLLRQDTGSCAFPVGAGCFGPNPRQPRGGHTAELLGAITALWVLDVLDPAGWGADLGAASRVMVRYMVLGIGTGHQDAEYSMAWSLVLTCCPALPQLFLGS